MHRHIVTAAMLGFNAIVLSITFGSWAANAQESFNFIESNQSRQFFDEGNEIMEREIQKLLLKDLEAPTIKLPENISRYQTIDESDSIYARMKLKPISQVEIDSWE